MSFVAKTGRDGQGRPEWLSLRVHSLDVATVVHRLLAAPVLQRRLAQAAGLDLGPYRDRLAVLAGLHDLGKADARWQAYVRGTAPKRGHVAPALAALQVDPALAAALAPVMGWTDYDGLVWVVVCHHGGPVPEAIVDRYLATAPMDATAVSEIASLLDELLVRFPGARPPLEPFPWTPALSHLFAGLLMAADWIASGVMPLTGDEFDPVARQAHLDRALEAAGRWHGQQWPLLQGTELRPAQRALRETGPAGRLVILEDMTGSGKTEAAALWGEKLITAGRVDGLYFALPTRAAATEIHARLARIIGEAVPSLAGRVTRVVPGQVEADPTREEDEPSSWHLGGTRQAMMASVAVGTIDQALASILRARHAWLRRSWLVRRLLVIDEVHAGDPYMLAHVERLVHAQLDAGGYVLCMSATLGSSARARLTRTDPIGLDAACAITYPALWLDDALPKEIEAVQPRRYEIEVLDPAACLEQAEAAALTGARVLIIRSTVADALATRDWLRGRGLPTVLHHSRYADSDRRLLDSRVLGVLGLARKPDPRPPIIVATQTCEQSLDIDADLLITDACPADVLQQRLGRLHRHNRPRPPGFGSKRCLLIDPGTIEELLTGDPRHPQRGRAGQGWAWIYPAVPVAATVAWLRQHPALELPGDARAIVEAATHPEALSPWRECGPAWQVAHDAYVAGDRGQREAAELLQIPFDQLYGPECVPDPAASSRLGELPVTIETPGLVSPFTGEPIEAMPVPARWLHGVAPGTIGLVEGQTIRVGTLLLHYTEDGLARVGSEVVGGTSPGQE